MTENDSPSSGSGDTSPATVENDLYVTVGVDGGIPHNFHCKSDVTINLFGGTKDKPLFLGKVLIKKNGGKYVQTLNFDRVYPVHNNVSGDGGARQ